MKDDSYSSLYEIKRKVNKYRIKAKLFGIAFYLALGIAIPSIVYSAYLMWSIDNPKDSSKSLVAATISTCASLGFIIGGDMVERRKKKYEAMLEDRLED